MGLLGGTGLARTSAMLPESRPRVRPVVVLLSLGVIGAAVMIGYAWLSPGESKTNEARSGLKRMYDLARQHYLDHGSFPPAEAGPTPPLGACCEHEEGCPEDAADWQAPEWKALGFRSRAQYYSFEYQPTQTADGRPGFVVRAFGDLDCDGEYSTYRMVGEVNPDYAR
ncbi:MAG: hypothetical protein KJO07_21575 [Deltaproteobacteria bacterium]|nr:hypothetical protein [Deltaproteobacteria bacterium]